jgi:hypothetical protein
MDAAVGEGRMGQFCGRCVLNQGNGPQPEGDGVWQCTGGVRPPDSLRFKKPMHSETALSLASGHGQWPGPVQKMIKLQAKILEVSPGESMAQTLTQEEFDALPIVPYEEMRSQLRPGDLFFASGNSLSSRAVKFSGKSIWSHVGLIFPDFVQTQRVILLESRPTSGVRLVPLSVYTGPEPVDSFPYDAKCAVARIRGLSEEQALGAAERGMSLIGKSYDINGVVQLFLDLFLKIPQDLRDEEYLCSELVWECFRYVGLQLGNDPEGKSVMPNDLWLDPRVELVARML